jgi:hypothetical protein
VVPNLVDQGITNETPEKLGPTSTRLTQLSVARFKHVFKLMGLLFSKKMEREGKQVQVENFARMKALIEEGAPA